MCWPCRGPVTTPSACWRIGSSTDCPPVLPCDHDGIQPAADRGRDLRLPLEPWSPRARRRHGRPRPRPGLDPAAEGMRLGAAPDRRRAKSIEGPGRRQAPLFSPQLGQQGGENCVLVTRDLVRRDTRGPARAARTGGSSPAPSSGSQGVDGGRAHTARPDEQGHAAPPHCPGAPLTRGFGTPRPAPLRTHAGRGSRSPAPHHTRFEGAGHLRAAARSDRHHPRERATHGSKRNRTVAHRAAAAAP